MRSRRLARAAVGSVAVVAAVSTSIAPAPAQADPASSASGMTLRFGPCPPEAPVRPTVGCAKLKVPLDYSKPHGRQITLTVSAAGDVTAKHYMIVNPGGPGYPGIGTEQMIFGELPEAVTAQYAVFSFDPRGTGLSTPITCGDVSKIMPRPALPYRPKSASQEKQRVRQAQKIAKSCGAHAKGMLPYLTVANEARDMDRIRIALGKNKIDYLGYSAGTDLGAVYATMFPKHTGRMVLDSVVDPTVSAYQTGYQQDPALQNRVDAMFAWAGARDKTYHLGTTRAGVERTWTRLRAKLAAHPAGGRAGATELDDMLASATYIKETWSDLMSAVRDYQRGDDDALLVAADQLAEQPISPALLAYQCTEKGWPKNWKVWHDDTVEADKNAPSMAWLNTWSSAPCAFWPAKPSATPRIGSVKVPPILLLTAKADAATPLIGAQRMRAVLPNSRLLVSGGGDHAEYLNTSNPCVDAKATRYWLTGKLPTDGTCPTAKPL